MAELRAIFTFIDQMSDKIGAVADGGLHMVESFESAGSAINSAFDNAVSGTGSAISSVENFNRSIEAAAAKTDFWTDAVGNYDKSALEAVYSTEELVDMGMKSADALEQEADIMNACSQAASQIQTALDSAAEVQEEYSSAMEEANRIAEEIADNDRISAETKEELQRATEAAAASYNELCSAQKEAESALENYNQVLQSGTASLEEVEAAARSVTETNDKLSSASENAASSTEKLAKATDNVAEEAEKAGKKGIDAINQLSAALTAAGITKIVKAIADSLLDAAAASAQTEIAFAKLQTIAGNTAMLNLSGQIKELSAETGIAQNALADVAYNAISAGSAVEKSVGVAESATKLAAAGFTDTASALSVLSTAMNSYGNAAGTAEEISDSLIVVQNLGVTTVADLAANMGKSISTASAYNVSLGNLESAYVSITKAGINTAEATTYVSAMMSELGKEGSTVSDILKEQTGKSFGQLMSSGYSLADTLDILYKSAGNDAEALMNLWGSQTAGVAASAIVNQGLSEFNSNLTLIENSAGATESAYSVMANTTEHAHQKMQTNVENLKIAIGDNLTPVLEKVYNIGANAFQWATDFATEHPAVVKGITAVAIGIGVVAAGIAGLTFVSNVAIPAIAAFGAAFNTAFGPIGWVVMALTGIIAAGTALVSMMNDSEESIEAYDGTLSECADEIENTELALENAIDRYGENSDVVQELEEKLDTLNKQYELGGGIIGEYAETAGNAAKKLDELQKSENDAMAALDKTNVSGLTAVSMLESLSGKADITNADLDVMSGYADYLNDTFNCNIQVNYDTGELTGFDPGVIVKQIQDSYNEKKQAIAFDTISDVDFIDSYKAEYESLAGAKAEYDKILNENQEKADKAFKKFKQANQDYVDGIGGIGDMQAARKEWESYQKTIDDAANEIDYLQNKFDGTNKYLKENCNIIDESGSLYDDMVDSLTSGTDSIEKYGEAVNDTMTEQEAWDEALSICQEELDNLCIAYDEAYNAALTSFQGQFGLFDTAEADLNATVENAQAALYSQLAYWTEYGNNIDVLKNTSAETLGITQENYDLIMSKVQDGSAEAAGLAGSIVDALNKGDVESVAVLARTYGNVQRKQGDIASATAEWQTDFNSKMESIISDMGNYVSKLNFSSKAGTAATNTMNTYARNIRAGKIAAVNAASEVANAVEQELKRINTNLTFNSTIGAIENIVLKGNARGTTNAEDVFIAGEEGPELIVDKAGSTVFPHSETNRIIGAVLDSQERTVNVVNKLEGSSFTSKIESLFSQFTSRISHVFSTDKERSGKLYIPDTSSKTTAESKSMAFGANDKKITLEISGKGNIELKGGKPDKESMLLFLYEHLKPVLTEIIEQEIYEEGDMSYVY